MAVRDPRQTAFRAAAYMIEHRSVTFGPGVDAVDAAGSFEGTSLRLLEAYVAAEEELIRVRSERDRLFEQVVSERGPVNPESIAHAMRVMARPFTISPNSEIAADLAEHDRREAGREG